MQFNICKNILFFPHLGKFLKLKQHVCNEIKSQKYTGELFLHFIIMQ